MYLKPKSTWQVDDYKDFCKVFMLQYPKNWEGFESEAIEQELEKLRGLYNLRFFYSKSGGYYEIYYYGLGEI